MNDRFKADDWLILLLRAFDIFMNPSPHKILESFESWEHRNRLHLELRQLRRNGMIEPLHSRRGSPWRLTAHGRLTAEGGVDPVSRWSRPWDGRWRLLLFDLPARQARLRLALWRWLRRHRFGYLQQSVWIVPDAMSASDIPLRHLKLTPESLTVIEGAPAPPDTNEDIVRSAWDFALINRKYQIALEVAVAGRRFARDGRPVEKRRWLADERTAWSDAISSDPLLPKALLPKDYLGQRAHRERQVTFSLLGRGLAEGYKT
jgi:phenylacetic acid degradation operon negative regulatory protein